MQNSGAKNGLVQSTFGLDRQVAPKVLFDRAALIHNTAANIQIYDELFVFRLFPQNVNGKNRLKNGWPHPDTVKPNEWFL